MIELADWLLHLYEDPTLGIVAVVFIVILAWGLMLSRDTIISIFRGTWLD